MRFSQGTAASLIATTIASSSSHAGATTTSTTTTTTQLAAAADDAPLQLQDYADANASTDTGILSSSLSSSRHYLTRSRGGQLDEDPVSPASSSGYYYHDDDHQDDGNKQGSDSSSSTRELQAAPAWCSEGYVTCINGFDALSPTTPCTDSCFDAGSGTAKCCYGSAGTCQGFTGKVCKDGASCMGNNACYNAKIPQVKNSCQGSKACGEVAATAVTAGVVGTIINSCNGGSACYQAGKNGGTIGNIQNSCIGNDACKLMARDGGKVGNIQDSCVGTQACPEISITGGTVGDITTSCTFDFACPAMGMQGGKVGSVTNSCTANKSCFILGFAGGVTGNIQDSCTAYNACFHLGALSGGSIGSITASCKATYACYQAGKGTNSIGSSKNLNNCCNDPNSCQDASAATLPAVCAATDSPSSAPTSASTTSVPTAPKPSTTSIISKAPTKSPVFVTLSFVGGCPAQISDADAVHYEPGDRVSKGMIVFECTSWPNSLFCNQVAFNPPDDLDSKSTDWKQAWSVVGHCTGTLAPPTAAGCPDAWTSGDMTKYKENDLVSVITSSSPLIKITYKCKAWPYSWYCGQLSPLDHNGGVLGWELVGECTGTIGPTSSPTFNPLSVIAGCPEEYNSAAIENYVAGDKVSVAVKGSDSNTNVFVCREFPYSGYCGQSGFAPGEQYDYMAWTLLGPCEGTLAPTSAPSAYSGGASCTYTKVVTTTPTPTPIVTPVGTWTAGTLYDAGNQVRIGAKKFQCKPWPFYLWCRMSAYKPTLSETGLWTEAWTVAGECPAAV